MVRLLCSVTARISSDNPCVQKPVTRERAIPSLDTACHPRLVTQQILSHVGNVVISDLNGHSCRDGWAPRLGPHWLAGGGLSPKVVTVAQSSGNIWVLDNVGQLAPTSAR
jgi:hypothetical protein